MSTAEDRGNYERSAARYPSDVTDEEWVLIEPHLAPERNTCRREILNARIASAGNVTGVRRRGRLGRTLSSRPGRRRAARLYRLPLCRQSADARPWSAAS